MPAAMDSTAFRITDAHYGYCGSVHMCRLCGFRQCSGVDDVLAFYEKMDDSGYEESRQPRAVQAARLLGHIARYCPSGPYAGHWSGKRHFRGAGASSRL